METLFGFVLIAGFVVVVIFLVRSFVRELVNEVRSRGTEETWKFRS